MFGLLKLGSVDITVYWSDMSYNSPKLIKPSARECIVQKDGFYKGMLCQANNRASKGEWKKRDVIRQHEKKVIHKRLVELIEGKERSCFF